MWAIPGQFRPTFVQWSGMAEVGPTLGGSGELMWIPGPSLTEFDRLRSNSIDSEAQVCPHIMVSLAAVRGGRYEAALRRVAHRASPGISATGCLEAGPVRQDDVRPCNGSALRRHPGEVCAG